MTTRRGAGRITQLQYLLQLSWRSSQNAQNANFALTEFYEIQQSFRTRTYGRVLRGSSFFASYALAGISERVSAQSTTTSIVPPQGSGRKEARNVRPDGHHPGLYLSIAHFR